ncbi:hypothetical protein [Gordonia hydrophobica]|uniref:Uncharacterized protein n=1 Tax=Gordonia hydrophobica TaxID=40516 RepID=A0ABZ2U9E3_9ACTN|nr:hypothetical protein [Gordonia hydrophobica]MBM7365369.1 hypothetical protein [Gordonia hydrophobica]
MNPNDDATVSTDEVVAAAALVDLPLSDDDATAVGALLSQWIPAAQELNARMRAAENTAIAPITTFTTPDFPHQTSEGAGAP